MLEATQAAKVVEALRRRIMSGEYPAGAFLPSERNLSAELGVARNTLRAAMNVLESEGLVARKGRHGVMVCERRIGGAGGLALVALRGGPNGDMGAISPEQMGNLGGVLCAASREDIRVQLVTVRPSDPAALLDTIESKKAIGVILLMDKAVEVNAALRRRNVPYVIVNEEHDLPEPATRMDFWGIGRSAAEHLLDLGHTRLAVLGGPSERAMYEKFLAGFRGRAAESGVFVADAHVRRVTSSSEEARAATLDLLDRPGAPTAIFCTRDVRAYGAYLAARERGLRVPDDLSLIGYDDLTWPGRGERFLTTFPELTDRLGGEAVRMLVAWVETGLAPEPLVIRPKLLVRKSTAPCPVRPPDGE